MTIEERVRTGRLRRRLLAVLLCDAAGVAAVAAVAAATRRRSSGPAFAAIAASAAVSLVPSVCTVVREERAHRAGPNRRHAAWPSVLLIGAGVAINTIGNLGAPVRGPGRRPESVVRAAILAAGDGIAAPYLLAVRALHTRDAAGPLLDP